MDKVVSIKELIGALRTSDFLVQCAMPLGYAEGYPVLRQCNGEVLLMIPFLKYQVTGKRDQTLVYPIRYTVTVRVRDGKVVGFQDLSADGRFAKVDFDRPIGLFRHEAIRDWNKQTYQDNRQLLYRLYDGVCAQMLAGTEVTGQELSDLLKMMVEPCQMPIYQAMDRNFYDTYLA